MRAASLTRLNLSKANLLIIEDNPQGMDILSQILLGFGVTKARKCESAEEGYGAIAKQAFDLIIVDQDMPGEDGLTFCQKVRADEGSINFTTAIIVLTALPSRDVIAATRDAGANFIVAKPVSSAVLLQRIEWIARSKRSFVTSDLYRGPDRRFKNLPLPEGIEERREDAMRLMGEVERPLSQDEINSLFD